MINRDNAKEVWPIIKAYAEGKQIQFYTGNEWEDRDNFSFDADPSRYRIKPQPKYRPFKSVEECWNEMKNHQPFGWVKIKNNNKFTSLLDVRSDDDFEFKFNLCIFADGSPFGIKEE